MQKNPAAVALGKLGGSATSRAKTRAARENAKLGGWPKGRKRGKRKKRPSDSNALAHSVVMDAAKLTQQASIHQPPTG